MSAKLGRGGAMKHAPHAPALERGRRQYKAKEGKLPELTDVLRVPAYWESEAWDKDVDNLVSSFRDKDGD